MADNFIPQTDDQGVSTLVFKGIYSGTSSKGFQYKHLTFGVNDVHGIEYPVRLFVSQNSSPFDDSSTLRIALENMGFELDFNQPDGGVAVFINKCIGRLFSAKLHKVNGFYSVNLQTLWSAEPFNPLNEDETSEEQEGFLIAIPVECKVTLDSMNTTFGTSLSPVDVFVAGLAALNSALVTRGLILG